MDDEFRKLEREYQTNPTLDIAERIVQCRMRTGSLDTLMEINEYAFHQKHWDILCHNIDANDLKIAFLQLPHGVLLKDVAFNGNGFVFVPGIKISKLPYCKPEPDPFPFARPGE